MHVSFHCNLDASQECCFKEKKAQLQTLSRLKFSQKCSKVTMELSRTNSRKYFSSSVLCLITRTFVLKMKKPNSDSERAVQQEARL